MKGPLISWNSKVALIAKPGGSNTGIGRYVQMLHSSLYEAAVDVVRVAPTVPLLPNMGYSLLRRLGVDLPAFLSNYPIWVTYPEADIYHLTSQNLATLLFFHRPKGKVVVTVHDIIPYMLRNDPQLSTYRTIVDRLFDRLAMAGLKRADHLIAISQFTKQCLVEQLGITPEKITVIYYGIDHEYFKPLPIPQRIRERYRLPEGCFYLLFVGSDDPRKNLATLVQALVQVRMKLANVELIKVGRAYFDQERQRLINLATKLGVRAAIHFLEDVTEDLPLLYNLADVCIMPSLYEGFGFPLLEAMACGTPVVCANRTSLPEIQSGAGLLFEHGPNAAEDLSSAILQVLTDPQLSLEMRVRGQDRAAAFDWSNTARRTIEVYQDNVTNPKANTGRRTLQNHIIDRGLDLLLDPRLPHAAPYNLWRLWHYTVPKLHPHVEQTLHLCLTFDIEQDFRNPESAASSERFLPRYLEWAHTRGWCSTLYIQGDVIPRFSDLLCRAQKHHELGLHGLHHEVWGRSRWWQYRLGLVGLTETEKRERLLQALGLFERAHLGQPRTFRAPYLNLDRKTLTLLVENGFTSDSSPATYLGALPIPRHYSGIWQIPVTANPRPEWNMRGARYPELTLGTMRGMSEEQIMASVSLALFLQQCQTGLPLHLVFLAHPWEFESMPGIPTASEANWEFLDRIVNMITKVYRVDFVTMSQLVISLSTSNFDGK